MDILATVTKCAVVHFACAAVRIVALVIVIMALHHATLECIAATIGQIITIVAILPRSEPYCKKLGFQTVKPKPKQCSI